jgi:DNA-binding winged helix-turn-helix (wHTH) protein
MQGHGVRSVLSHVHPLRRSFAAVGDDPIETVPTGYHLTVNKTAVDAERFKHLVAEARVALAAEQPGCHRLTEALELWPPFAEFLNAG